MLNSIKIENFKRIQDKSLILDELAQVNYLVGENASGENKSFVLTIFLFIFQL